MSLPAYKARRATLEDISALNALWLFMHLPAEDLSKRVTEFQVAEDSTGKIVGALGLEIVNKHGRIHSETFSDFGLSGDLRPLLWERIQTVANNHGVVRLWCQEDAPFWSRCGMVPADAETLPKLPPIWSALPPKWHTLKLKDDIESVLSLDKEFAVFMQAEKEKTARTMRHAKSLKVVATLVALGLFCLVIVAVVIIFKRNPNILHR